MAQISWAQLATDDFFRNRKSPTQSQCDQIATSISGASTVRAVENPGSLSYTVICLLPRERNLIVSFRGEGSSLDPGIVETAKTVHDNLVPESIFRGTVQDADPLLEIYSMPYLPGISFLDASISQVEINSDNAIKLYNFVRSLAKYASRCWSNPQLLQPQKRLHLQRSIAQKLSSLKREAVPIPSQSLLNDLEHILPTLFGSQWVQVLTHSDLSMTNILVDENTHEITGIVDWSLGAVQPFGLELDCLLLGLGYMDLEGWHDYDIRPQLAELFWNEFWSASGVTNPQERQWMRTTADAASNIGIILRYCFQRNSDGSPSDVIQITSTGSKFVTAWLDHKAGLKASPLTNSLDGKSP